MGISAVLYMNFENMPFTHNFHPHHVDNILSFCVFSVITKKTIVDFPFYPRFPHLICAKMITEKQQFVHKNKLIPRQISTVAITGFSAVFLWNGKSVFVKFPRLDREKRRLFIYRHLFVDKCISFVDCEIIVFPMTPLVLIHDKITLKNLFLSVRYFSEVSA